MILHYDFIDYEINKKEMAIAIADIMWSKKQRILQKENAQLKLDKISYRMGIINFILGVENDGLEEAIEEEFHDLLLDNFATEAREYYKNCVDDMRYKQSFDYGARGTFGD